MSVMHILMADGQQMTYDVGHVMALRRQGMVTNETLYWMEGMADWRPLVEHEASTPLTSTGIPSAGESTARLPPYVPPIVFRAPVTQPAAHTSEPDFNRTGHQFQFMHITRFLRLAAAMIDLALLIVPAIVTIIVARGLQPEPGVERPHFAVFFCFGLYLLLLILTQTCASIFFGRSIGKSLFRLRAVDARTKSKRGFLGYCVRFLTHGTLAIFPLTILLGVRMTLPIILAALLYAIVDALFIFYDDRCVHDYIARTIVARREY